MTSLFSVDVVLKWECIFEWVSESGARNRDGWVSKVSISGFIGFFICESSTDPKIHPTF